MLKYTYYFFTKLRNWLWKRIEQVYSNWWIIHNVGETGYWSMSKHWDQFKRNNQWISLYCWDHGSNSSSKCKRRKKNIRRGRSKHIWRSKFLFYLLLVTYKLDPLPLTSTNCLWIAWKSLLILHLSIQKLTKISSMSKHYGERNNEMFKNLISTCRRVLKQIKDITRRSGKITDIAHNLSWVGNVFPGIDGVLLWSIFSIYYHFGIEGNNIVEEVNNIMIESTLIHPCISEALNALSLAKYNDTTTGTNLLKCCFLVPSPKQ